MNPLDQPKTLQQAIVYFADTDNCLQFMVERRWPDGIVKCPTCGSENVSFLAKRRLWQCKTRHPKAQFSIKVGTIFEDSPIGLDKWLTAMWLIANCKNGVSSHEIAASLGITQKSAWHMLHRIRLAMKECVHGAPNNKIGTPGPLGNAPAGQAHASANTQDFGDTAVEVDETFIGGKLANMHKGRLIKLREGFVDSDDYEQRKDNKVPVVGMFDRSSRQVRAKVVKNVKRETLQKEILRNVKYGSAVYTDEAVVHSDLRRRYIHDTVNHAETYVNGNIHTNSLENFWSLLKRNLAGTYVAVEPFHLDRYLDEQMFRFNNRLGHTAASRFSKMVSQIVDRRLTYAELTGKTAVAAGEF